MMGVRQILGSLPAVTSIRTRRSSYLVDIMVASMGVIGLTYYLYCLTSLALVRGDDGDPFDPPPPPQSDRTLLPYQFPPLPLGSILPNGWLLNELQAMTDGLAGHENDFYVYVTNSSWLVGREAGWEYSSLNEAYPYWFNGIVPLAYLTNNSRLKSALTNNLADILGDTNGGDGWIGPEAKGHRNFWGRTPFLLGAAGVAEAEGDTTAWEIIQALSRFMWVMNDMLWNDGEGLVKCPADIDCSWGEARVADMILVIQWLLENNPNVQNTTQLFENMDLLYKYTNWKWEEWYTPGVYQEVIDNPTRNNPNYPFLHGVNVGQGLKAPAVIRRFKGNETMRKAAWYAVNMTFAFHGSPSATILGDEIERDLAPYSGSELCTTVETAYSLAYLYHALGDPMYADLAEMNIYNALPSMMTDHHWGHQYVSQPNQPWARFNKQEQAGPHVFTTTHSGAATTFGMEPEYPCCTVNHPQGLPKFVTNSWGGVNAGWNVTGIAHLLLGPSSVLYKGINITCKTNYPFDNMLNYTIEFTQSANRSHDLYFYIRAPGWHNLSSTKLTMGHGTNDSMPVDFTIDETGLVPIIIPYTQCYPGAQPVTVSYTIGSDVRVVPRANDTVAVYWGSLLFSLDLGQTNTSSYPHPYKTPDSNELTEIPFPQVRDWYMESLTPWNVAIDISTLEYFPMTPGEELPNPAWAYQYETYGGEPYIQVKGCEIAWDLYLNSTPGPPPAKNNRTCIKDWKVWKMIPYGRAKVHMSELPTINLNVSKF